MPEHINAHLTLKNLIIASKYHGLHGNMVRESYTSILLHKTTFNNLVKYRTQHEEAL